MLSEHEKHILGYLQSTNAARTRQQVAAALRIPAHLIVPSLVRLRDLHLIDKTDSGWRARTRIPPDSATSTSSPPTTTAPGRSADPPRRASPGPAPNGLTDNRTIDPASRWADFRRLCTYYAACVRIEERANVSAFSNQEGTEFLTLDGPVDWRSVGAGQPLRISGREEWAPFFRRNRGRGPYHTYYLGTPIDIFVGTSRQDEAYRLISPALVVSVVADMRDGCVEIRPTNLVEVNHLWVERRIPDQRKRRDFLDQVGLSPTPLGDADQDELWAVGGFKEAVKALFVAKKDWWREYPDLDALSKHPPLEAVSDSGLYNRAVLMCQPALKFTRRLVDELQRLAYDVSDEDLDRTALAAIFPHRPPPSVTTRPAGEYLPDIAECHLLNSEQRVACHKALTAPLVTVTGPPGTGKSVVVAHVLINSAINGRSALFASRNHQAIEAVEPRINAMVEPEALVLRPTRPFGAHAAQFEWYQAMTALLARPRRDTLLGERNAAQRRVVNLLALRRQLELTADSLINATDTVATAEERCREVAGLCPQSWTELASSHLGAAEPARLQLLHALGLRLSRVRSRWYLAPFQWIWRSITVWRLKSALRQVMEAIPPTLQERIVAASPSNADPTVMEGVQLAEHLRRFFDYVSVLRERARIEASLATLPSWAKLGTELRDLRNQLEEATRSLMRLVAESAGAQISEEQREEFAQLRAAMRNRPHELAERESDSEVAKAFRRAMPELMQHFPVWSVSNLSVSRAIPLAPGCFDLLVLDEASQCDIASVVPLLYRAARACVVGDPNQLAHVTQLGRDTDMRLREHAGVAGYDFERFTFAANSMYDLASSSKGRISVALTNHYRCHPDIAEFCNHSFYNGTLRVMTDAEALITRLGLSRGLRACVWQHVPNDAVGASSGCYSPAQIDRILEELTRLAGQSFPGTVGVVTPFRAHAQRVNDLVHQRFDNAQLTRWRFLVDTVDGFQGDERDLIIFSLVGGAGMPPGSAYFLRSTPNRFNVAVSRARAVLRVFGDEEWAAQCGIPFITELLRRCRASESLKSRPRRDDLVGPIWEPLFADSLRSVGVPFEQQYPACGFYLDFALFGAGGKLNIEIDGEAFHRSGSGGHTVDDIYRDLVLEAAGWRVIRFWVYQLRENINECIDRVQREYREHCGPPASPSFVSAPQAS